MNYGPIKHFTDIEAWKLAEDLFNRGLCLPSGTAMTEEDLDRVVDVIRKIEKSKGKRGKRR
jgi:dTDP-4-amino-4,6-dideoxygalactose transaminase